jgi:hypothetical protein
MPDDEDLRPATREEVVEGLSFAMRYKGRQRVRDDHADGFMSRVAAERLADHLHLSGFVVMKRPPMRAHSDTAHPRPRLKE